MRSVAATDWTPGTRRTRSSTSLQAARVVAGFESALFESATRVISTFRMSMPGWTANRRRSVRPNIPAVTSRTMAKAISDTTKPLCRRRELPARVRPPARSVCSRSREGARRAGASPKRRPLNREAPTANRSTCQSNCTSSARGKLPGQSATNGRTPTAASKAPNKPPESPSTALSVRHWRTSRLRPAPRAVRMASSRSRETARANSRLATLTQAISSTTLTAPSSNHRVDRTSPTSSC